MPNFINMYFGLCIIVWAIDVVAVAAIVCIKPLRKWLWKKYCEVSQEFIGFWMSIFPD